LISEPYFSRGKEYVTSRTIKITAVTETSVSGKIVGSYVYSIKLFFGKSGLEGTCTCPAFTDFGPCKHLAALGLAIIAYHKGDFHDLAEGFEGDVAEVEEFEKSLKKKSKDELIAMILQISGWYPDIICEFMD
jgi:uncharacterized Zn finger protein